MENNNSEIQYQIMNCPFVCTRMGFLSAIEDGLLENENTMQKHFSQNLTDISPDAIIHISPDSSEPICLNTIGLTYVIVCSKTQCKVLMTTDGAHQEEIYVNGIWFGYANDWQIAELNLHPGKNIIAYKTNINKPTAFLMRFCTIEADQQEEISVFARNPRFRGTGIYVREKNYTPFKRGVYEYCLQPSTTTEIDVSKPVCVEIVENSNRTVLDVFYVSFGIWYSIDLQKYEYAHDDVNYLTVRFLYHTFHNEIYLESRSFSFYPMAEQLQAFEKYLYFLQSKMHLSSLRETGIQYYLEEYQRQNKNSISILQYVLTAKNKIDRLLNDRHQNYFATTGITYLYFKSKLDGKILKIPVKIPRGYLADKPYPLLIHFDLQFYEENCYGFDTNEAIVIDMTGRGFTMGGYIGEATFFEILELVKQYYQIDENRIYGVGHCSAGIAVLNLAHNHPGLFAAVLVSDCPTTPLDVMNLENTPILLVCRDNALNENVKRLASLPLTKVFSAQSMTHNMLYKCWIQKDHVEMLLQYTRTLLPHHVHFLTVSCRYQDAYWISLMGRRETYTTAIVDAEIVSNNYIRITTDGSQEVHISIPKQIMSESFDIEINNRRFQFHKTDQEVIKFVWNRVVYELCNEVYSKQSLFIGFGLLDVYEKPLCIWNRHVEDKYYQSTARNFATPSVNAHQSAINVCYPIVNEIDEKEMDAHSVIILDDCTKTNHPVLTAVRARLHVKCYPKWFEYQGRQYCGSYCIMQVIENPYDSSCSVLHICCNDSTVLHENLFTRRLILSSLASGINPFLNGIALIYQDRKYVRIDYVGGELKPCLPSFYLS